MSDETTETIFPELPPTDLTELQIQRLIQIWGSGMVSGAATLAGNAAERAGLPEEFARKTVEGAHHMAAHVVHAMVHDPLGLEKLRGDVIRIWEGRGDELEFEELQVFCEHHHDEGGGS